MTCDYAWVGQAGRIGTLLAVIAMPFGTAAAQEVGQEEQNVAAEQTDDEVVEEVIVTGTRLRGGDPTARVNLVTADDIARQGLTTVEDVIRSLPQNFSTINSSNSLDFGSDLLDASLGALGLGAATANLRGFGSKNTLVLVNGKRLAGIESSAEQLATNLNDIPSGAIERIEISLDGGSAVYGSDGVAGVINIITKQDFKGFSVGAKMENSSTGGDARSVNLYGGTGWGSGSASAIVTMRKSDPVKAAKTGWTSNDYSGRYGGDQRYNFIDTSSPRSGTVALSRWGPAALILPPGNDGRNAQPGDFVAPQASDYIDVIREDITSTVDSRSVTGSLLQNFGARDQVELRADLLWSETETASAVSTFGFGSIQVPASNAFNNFGQPVFVGYYADTEVEQGLLPQVEQRDLQWQLRYVLSAAYALSDNLRLEIDYIKAESSSEGDQFMFAPPSRYSDDPQRYQRLLDLLASSDPSVALNLFGDGTGQNSTIGEFYRSFANDNAQTHVRIVEPKLTGEPWQLPGGEVGFVVGAELRRDWVETPGDDFYEGYIGSNRPTRELTAYFLEATVPLVGGGNRRALLESLVLSFQVRYDGYSVEGSIEGDEEGNPILIQAEYSNTVKRVGMAWSPTGTLVLRGSRSEAFRAPSVSNLFGGTQVSRESNFVYDPLRNPPWVPAIQSFGPNPDLLPETSTNWTLGMEWRPAGIEGLVLKAAWSSIDFEDRIASSFELSGLLPVEVYGNLPEFFVRDEAGNLIEAITRPINISRRADERLDLEVSYRLDTAFGTILPRVVYHRVLDMFDQAVPGGEEFAFFGESVGVDKYKLDANLSLIAGRITADLWIRHIPGYINNDFEDAFNPLPNEPVASYTTTDLTAAYQMDNGLLFRVGGRNIFDRDFPFMLSSSRRPYDSQRVDVRKRVLFLEAKYSVGR